jgi:Flp pilus assembly protein CpaB
MALAVLLGLATLAPPRPSMRFVVVAARDLAAGQLLSESDLALAGLPDAVVPDGTFRTTGAIEGRVVAGALRRGEPLTDVALVGPGLLRGAGPGGADVAAPVRIADADSVALLRTGDRIDVLGAVSAGTGSALSAAVVASDVRVLAVPTASGDGALVVLAVPRGIARDLAEAAVAGPLSFVIDPTP